MPVSIKKQVIAFSPNLIHSIDGAIARLLIISFYSKTKVIVETLHDSFRVHPSLVSELRMHLKNIYNKKLVCVCLSKLLNFLLLDGCEVKDTASKKIIKEVKKSEIKLLKLFCKKKNLI